MENTSLFVIIILFLCISFIIIISLYIKYSKLKLTINNKVKENFDKWVDSELDQIRKNIETISQREKNIEIQEWKSKYTNKIRVEAIEQSKSVTFGKISEQLAPFFPNFTYNPNDAKFIGNPIDLIIFDGLKNGFIKNIIFLEIKTGIKKSLNKHELLVKDAVFNKRVEWEILKI